MNESLIDLMSTLLPIHLLKYTFCHAHPLPARQFLLRDRKLISNISIDAIFIVVSLSIIFIIFNPTSPQEFIGNAIFIIASAQSVIPLLVHVFINDATATETPTHQDNKSLLNLIKLSKYTRHERILCVRGLKPPLHVTYHHYQPFTSP